MTSTRSFEQSAGKGKQTSGSNLYRFLRARFALLKCSCGFGEKHEVVSEDAEDEFAVLGCGVVGGQR